MIRFAKNIYWHESLHFFSSFLVAVIVFYLYNSSTISLLAFFSGILIDADHLVEGIIIYGFKPIMIKKLLKEGFFEKSGYVTVFLHDWEIIPILFFLGWLLNFWPYAAAISLSLAVHYSVDTYTYNKYAGLSIYEYFFIYRLKHRFKYKELCGKKQIES